MIAIFLILGIGLGRIRISAYLAGSLQIDKVSQLFFGCRSIPISCQHICGQEYPPSLLQYEVCGCFRDVFTRLPLCSFLFSCSQYYYSRPLWLASSSRSCLKNYVSTSQAMRAHRFRTLASIWPVQPFDLLVLMVLRVP